MTQDLPRAAALAYFEAVGSADADGFVALFSPEAHFEDPVGGPVLRGEEGLRRFHKGLRRAWERIAMRPQAIFARGPRVAVHWEAAGTSATGKAIDFAGINLIEVDDSGRIARMEGYWDFEGVIGQM